MIQTKILNPIASKIIKDDVRAGDKIVVDEKNNDLTVLKQEKDLKQHLEIKLQRKESPLTVYCQRAFECSMLLLQWFLSPISKKCAGMLLSETIPLHLNDVHFGETSENILEDARGVSGLFPLQIRLHLFVVIYNKM